MAQFFCADCNWQGTSGACPLCGNVTESLDVEDISGMPRATYDMEFSHDSGRVDFRETDEEY